jgi:hypothetical protein
MPAGRSLSSYPRRIAKQTEHQLQPMARQKAKIRNRKRSYNSEGRSVHFDLVSFKISSLEDQTSLEIGKGRNTLQFPQKDHAVYSPFIGESSAKSGA